MDSLRNNMGMNMEMQMQMEMLKQKVPRSAIEIEIVKEALLIDFKRRWTAWNKLMTELVMKRFQGKIDPVWAAFLQEVLISRSPPTESDNDEDEDRLSKWMNYEILYPLKDPKAPGGQAIVRTFSIGLLLEAVHGGSGNHKEQLMKPPGRITDLLALRDPEDLRLMMKRTGILTQFLKMQTRGASLPAFIKNSKANPLKNATGQWMWAK